MAMLNRHERESGNKGEVGLAYRRDSCMSFSYIIL